MRNKIKIAVNARFLVKDKLEGIGTYSHEVLSRLVKLLPEVEFHFLFDRAYSEEFIYAKNVIPHKIGFPARHPFLWYLWFEFSIPKWLKKNKVDLFISPDSFLSLKSKVDTLLVMHDLAFEHFPQHNNFLVSAYYKYFFPRYANQAKKIISVSKFTKLDITKQYNISDKKIKLAYCGVSDVYKPISALEKGIIKKKLSDKKNYFICIGSLNPRKNIISAVKAFNLFKKETKSETKLVIVGAKAWKSKNLFKEIEKSNYKKDIIRTGHLKPKDLTKYLAASEALIFPSLFEGFGIPILEAFKCKIPVITSNVSSTKEIGEGIAYLVSPLNIHEIKDKMLKIQLNEERAIEHDFKLKQKLFIYNWDNTAIVFKEIIEKILS